MFSFTSQISFDLPAHLWHFKIKSQMSQILHKHVAQSSLVVNLLLLLVLGGETKCEWVPFIARWENKT